MVHATAESARSVVETQAIITRFFADRRVLYGPFAGMRCTASRGICSSILPKLLGSYEAELHSLLRRFAKRRYTAVVDIGCAEGYYAVGLARMLPNIQVYAYDTDPDARRLCAEMASANGVADRVHVRGFCTAEALRAIPLGDHALIVSDCEGYELSLFTPETVAALADHDLLIEVHDFMHLGLSSDLRPILERMHNVRSIKSIDDVEKASTYAYEAISDLAIETKFEIFREYRPAIMEWLVAESREHVKAPLVRRHPFDDSMTALPGVRGAGPALRREYE
jgi:hypothetical protein